MEGPLDVHVLAGALCTDVIAVTCFDHSVLVLGLQLPELPLVDIVGLLLFMNPTPVEEVVDLVVVSCHVVLHKYLVHRVGPDLHPPDVLAMLHEDVLRQLGIGSHQFIDESDEPASLQLVDPLVHEVAWQLLFELFFSSVEVRPVVEQFEATSAILNSEVGWYEYR